MIFLAEFGPSSAARKMELMRYQMPDDSPDTNPYAYSTQG